MLEKLYSFRFEIFFFTLIIILFGSLIMPSLLFENILLPFLFQVNILAGILLISRKKKIMYFLIGLLIITGILIGTNFIQDENNSILNFIKMIVYFLFYLVVTSELILQVWKAKEVGKNVIFGLVSGYVSLGLIGFFICLSIEMANPNSFQGLLVNNTESLTEGLMYFSYVTLLTIGYGDIIPVTKLAHKAAILIGLMGQIYLVVLTAIVVGKYINQTSNEKIKNEF